MRISSQDEILRSPSKSPMDSQKALAHVLASFQEGAELRSTVAKDCGQRIAEVAKLMVDCLKSGGKLLFFGNGGSAADAQHLAAEFVGRFAMERQALAALALTTDASILTAVGNDYGFDQIFSRQIQGLGQPDDIAVGISTSGNSPNVIAGIQEASKLRLKTVALAGKDGGALAKAADFPIVVRCANTARVQECHIAIGHIFCELVEMELTR